MHTATVEDIQQGFAKVLEHLAANGEVVVTQNGVPVAKLIPAASPRPVPVPGRGIGKLIIHSDDDDHLKDFEEYLP